MPRKGFLIILSIFFLITQLSGQANSPLTFPETSITYIYTGDNDSLPFIKSTCINSNDSIQLIKQVFQKKQWKNDSKIVFTTGPATSGEVTYSWNASMATWIPEIQEIKVFDKKNLIKTCRFYFSKKNADWKCSSEEYRYYNRFNSIDSILTYTLNSDSSELFMNKKEVVTSSYDKPVRALHYEHVSGTLLLTGKTEYMYYEGDHKFTSVYYDLKNSPSPRLKCYTDIDADGNTVYQENLNWDNRSFSWQRTALYVKEKKGSGQIQEMSYTLNKNKVPEQYKTITRFDKRMNKAIIETFSRTGSHAEWMVNSKTYNTNYTSETITQKSKHMYEQVYLSKRNIVVHNNKYAHSDYSLYALNGALLQKGTMDQNSININPNIENQTLVLILMTHSDIFSKKLNFMQ